MANKMVEAGESEYSGVLKTRKLLKYRAAQKSKKTQKLLSTGTYLERELLSFTRTNRISALPSSLHRDEASRFCAPLPTTQLEGMNARPL